MPEDAYEISWGDFESIEPMGAGLSPRLGGREFKAAWFGTEVAIKEVSGLEGLEEDSRSTAFEEFLTLKEIRHPNIVHFVHLPLPSFVVKWMGAEDGAGLQIGVCETESKVYTISEHLTDNVYRLLHDPSADLPWRRRIKIALEATLALTYLHSKGIIHRDFRSRNLLLSVNGRVKVSNMGLVRGGRGAPGDCNMEAVAPEVLMGDLHDERADIFGFGVVLFELITRRNPPPRSIGTKFGFDTEDFTKELNDSPGCPPMLRDLVLQCVATNPNNRPKPKTILTLLKEIKLAERRDAQQQKMMQRQRQQQHQQSQCEISEEDGEGSEGGGGSSSGGPITPLGSARRGSVLVISRSDSGAFNSSPLLSARSNGSGGGGNEYMYHPMRDGRERAASERNVRRNTDSGGGRDGSGIGRSGSGISENTDNDDEADVGYSREDDAMRRQRLSTERKKLDGGSGGTDSPSGRRKNSASKEEQLMSDVFGDKPLRRSRRNTKIFAEEEALESIFASNLGRDSNTRPRSQTQEKREEGPRKRRETTDPDKCLLM